MTRLDYDETEIYRNMGDDDNEDGFYLHSCSDKTQSLMIVDKRKSTRKRTSHHTSRRDSSDNQLSDNSEPLSGSVSSDSSDIAEEYSYSMFARSNYDHESYLRYQKMFGSAAEDYSPNLRSQFGFFCMPSHLNSNQTDHFRRVLRACLNSMVGLVKGNRMNRRQTVF